MTFILSNLHRFVRNRRKPEPKPEPSTPMAPADRAFLRWTVLAAVVLLAAIGFLWSLL